MDVEIDGNEMAMTTLNGLPVQYEILITALDALGDENKSFTLDTVKSQLLQEEQRREMRDSKTPSRLCFHLIESNSIFANSVAAICFKLLY